MNGKFTHKALAVALGVAMGAGTLIGCSGGGGGGTATTTSTVPLTGTGATLVGLFRDSPVSGLHFWAPSHHGKTDADGKFTYVENEIVSFGIATDDGSPAVKLGGATGKGVITPMDLMSRDADSILVQSIARTLLQLDTDGDSNGGIQLNDSVASILRGKLKAAGLDVVDYEQLSAALEDGDTANDAAVLTTLATVYDAVTATATELGITDEVTYEDAVAHLVNTDVDRKNVSKTPDLADNKAKLNQLDAYTPAMRANEDPVLPVDDVCAAGVLMDGVCKVKPMIITYAGVDARYGSAAMADAMAAVSRDDGATWKRVNLSRTGLDDVVVTDGDVTVNFKGESRKPVMMTKGNYVVVTWSDKYCKGGSPAYSLLDASGNPVNMDLYGVSGPQGYVDYLEDPTLDAERLQDAIAMAGGVQVPYSCVWAARGWVAEDGGLQWSKAERLTSGRRDAYQLTVAGAENAGFAIIWQEDPNGLLAGGGDGPGDGFSGAAVNHQTDIWYSYLPWSKVETPAAIDPSLTNDDVDDNPNDPVLLAANDGDITGTPGEGRIRLERFSVPVRISDNAACNFQNLASDGHQWCRLKTDGTVVDLDLDDDGVIDANIIASWAYDPTTVDPATVPEGRIDLSALGMKYCDDLVWSNDASVGWVCQTADGRMLDGDSGGSRPNLFLQAYTPTGKPTSAYAIVGYEETKGMGGGPTAVDVDVVDDGKNVIYHSFDFQKPDVIARGDVVNLPEREMLVQGDGNYLPGDPLIALAGDDTHPPIYQTENARRVRFILQGKKAAQGKDTNGDGIGDTGAGTVLIAIYKQGPEGKGRPSDIFARRMSIRNDDGSWKTGNPYTFANFVCAEKDAWNQCLKGAQNLSSVEPVNTYPPSNEDCTDTQTCYAKLVEWTWSVDNLDDESWETPMTESRAHRGQIRGDFVTFGYTWTPNWAASRKAHDKFDFFIRRSFDGGQTWTTDPKATTVAQNCKWTNMYDGVSGNEVLVCDQYGPGVAEPPRNVSLLKNHKESVIEPRVVAVDGTLLCGDVPCTPEDKQNPSAFVTSYGLANNVDDDGDGKLDHSEQYPTDMYYSRSMDSGTTYFEVEYPTGDMRWDWLAKRADVEEGEAQLRLTPDGNKLYATWLAESMADYSGPSHFEGSDIWFRKMDFNVGAAATDESGTTETTVDTEPGEQ